MAYLGKDATEDWNMIHKKGNVILVGVGDGCGLMLQCVFGGEDVIVATPLLGVHLFGPMARWLM